MIISNKHEDSLYICNISCHEDHDGKIGYSTENIFCRIYKGQIVSEIHNKICVANLNVSIKDDCYVNVTLYISYEMNNIEFEGVYKNTYNRTDDGWSENYLGEYVWITPANNNPYKIIDIYPVSSKYLLFTNLGPVLIMISTLIFLVMLIKTIRIIMERRNNGYMKLNQDY